MRPGTVSVVIVTHNSAADIARCLSSLLQHTPRREIIVVDNASKDDTGAIIERQFPEAQLISRGTNGGLSAAINDGVCASSGEYVLQLNPDTWVEADVLSPVAAYFAAHPDVGIVGPRILNADGSVQLSCRAFPGYTTALFNRYSLLTRLAPNNRFSRRYLLTDFDHASERAVDWVSGAAMFFRRSAFDAVGGWDSGFFLFNEDVDFCKRVHNAGMRVMYYPDVSIHHRIGISESASPWVIVQRHKSMWRYYRKHLSGNALRDAATAAGIAARAVVMLAAGGVMRKVRAGPKGSTR